MQNLALFDLDYTLLPIDSDYEWGNFLKKVGAVDPVYYEKKNDEFFAQYKAGTLIPEEFLEFTLGILSQFTRAQLDLWHEQYMTEMIRPKMLPQAFDLLKKHQDQGDLVAIVTATNRFVTAPIAKAFGVSHLISVVPEENADGSLTGKILGKPTSGKGKIFYTEKWLEKFGKKIADFKTSYFYSDSLNDLPLLSMVTNPVATNPDARLTKHATEKGWPILNLFK